MNRKDFEIMAPVGSYESLHAAIDAGADAVYFGIAGLNMRSRSSINFTLDDLRSIAALCAEHGVKTYLTVNTIIYDSDIDRCHEVIDAAREAGITAIIASDIAAIVYARSVGVEVHISTQCNISQTLRLCASIRSGPMWWCLLESSIWSRWLPSTRLLFQMTYVVQRANWLKIEMFCHGALCMAVSGKCYLSLHEMNSKCKPRRMHPDMPSWLYGARPGDRR